MSNPTPRVRFLINAFLSIRHPNGNTDEASFPAGSYHQIREIREYPDGYADVVLENGDVIAGIRLNDVLELHGEIKIVKAEYAAAPAKPAVEQAPTAKKNDGTRKS